MLPALLLSLQLLGAPAASLETADEIRACARANLPERDSLQRIELESHDRVGGSRKLELRVYWKRFEGDHPRFLVRVDRPSDVRGAAYLVIGTDGEQDDMFVYLPAGQKVRRITQNTMSGELWGTDFSYQDMKRLQGVSSQAQSERLPDTEIDGRPVYVVALTLSGTAADEYSRIVSFVDQETCVTLRTEFYVRAAAPRKVLVVDPASIQRDGARWTVRKLEMKDLRDETRTELRVIEVENDADLPDHIFSPSRLSR